MTKKTNAQIERARAVAKAAGVRMWHRNCISKTSVSAKASVSARIEFLSSSYLKRRVIFYDLPPTPAQTEDLSRFIAEMESGKFS